MRCILEGIIRLPQSGFGFYGYTQMDSDEADEGNGHYLITAEQVIGGLPVFGAIYSYGDFQARDVPRWRQTKSRKSFEHMQRALSGKTRSILQIRSSSNDDYAANIGMNKSGALSWRIYHLRQWKR